jgi:hypothetical protein
MLRTDPLVDIPYLIDGGLSGGERILHPDFSQNPALPVLANESDWLRQRSRIGE